MKRLVLAAVSAACLTAPAYAQSTATGVGVGVAKSSATAGAVAVGGGNAAGGNSTVNVTSTVPATQNITTNGSLKNVPTVFAPGLSAAGLETCLGSVSGGGGWLGTGFSFGTTIPDPGCNARLSARTLWSMGLRKAAIARLCLDADIYKSMPDVCAQYLPQVQPQPVYLSTGLSTAQILLIDGNTGKERLCNDYDEPHQKCRQWAYASPSEYNKPKTHKTTGNWHKPVPLPKVITAPSNGSTEPPMPLGPPI